MTEPTRVDGRSLRYKDRRHELLRACARYILDNGVGDLAMRPMAEAVGVSHATLLNHFGTKENLITEVVELLRDHSMPENWREALPEGVHIDGAQMLSIWWNTWALEQFYPALRLTFEVYGQALMHPERYERFLEHVIYDWTGLLEKFVAAAGCPPEDVAHTATLLVATSRGLQMDVLVTGDRQRVDAAHDLFMEIVRERQARWEPLGFIPPPATDGAG